MAGKVEQLIIRLRTLRTTLRQAVDDEMKKLAPELVDANRAQLLAGYERTGQLLGGDGEYHPITKQIRSERGLQIDHIDLKFTGDFHKSIRIKQDGRPLNYTFDATDRKWETDIRPRFGDEVLGLNASNENKLTQTIIRRIQIETKNHLGL